MKSHGWALVATVLMGTAGLGAAQQTSPAPPAKPASVKPAPKPPKRQHIAGTLVALDPEKATITFTDESGKTLTWPVEARLAQTARGYAQQRLETLKEGDRVRITYIVEAGASRVYDVKPAPAQSGGDQ